MKRISGLLLLFLLLLSSCSAIEETPQKKFGKDAAYFLALHAIENGNEKEAIRNFKIARQKGSSCISRRSAESLTVMGSVKDKVAAAKYLVENYDGENSLLIACRELIRDEEYSLVIRYTENVDVEYSENELVRIRLESLLEKKDSRFEKDFYKWMTTRQLSSEHLFLYKKFLKFKEEQFEEIQESFGKFQEKLNERSQLEQRLAPDYEYENDTADEEVQPINKNGKLLSEEKPVSPELQILEYRTLIYRRNYFSAFEKLESIIDLYKTIGEEIDDQLLSDIGKAALYGTTDFQKAGRRFEQLAGELSKPKSYYAFFYAARLYDMAGRFQNKVDSCYKAALAVAETSIQFDNALWYLLKFQLRTSTGDIIKTLSAYGSMISDASYFDDFFDSLCVLLLSNHRWQDFYEVWMKTNSNFSERIAGRYAYVSGRLIEEGLAEGEQGLKARQAFDAYTKVLSGGGDLYYKLLALERMNVSDNLSIENVLLVKGKDIPAAEGDADVAKMLDGYAAFGFPQKIYSEWLNYRRSLSVDASIDAGKFLNSVASFDEKDLNPEYRVQSLRIASRCYSMSYGRLPPELLFLSYPRFYKTQIENVCRANNLPEYIMYALVLSESFFDAGIVSKAGAMGLTQLMEGTAADEARKLKMFEYDVLNPEDNLKMGAHYLASLVSRTENNSVLLALFAYNAGLENVRRWVHASKRDWAMSGNQKTVGSIGIDMDIFLEMLPFAETREYGRKLVTASAIYAWLYEGRTPVQVIREIMK